MAAYSVGQHRHTPEIEQTLTDVAGQPVEVIFTPHLIPMDRGIFSTIYATPHRAFTDGQLLRTSLFSPRLLLPGPVCAGGCLSPRDQGQRPQQLCRYHRPRRAGTHRRPGLRGQPSSAAAWQRGRASFNPVAVDQKTAAPGPRGDGIVAAQTNCAIDKNRCPAIVVAFAEVSFHRRGRGWQPSRGSRLKSTSNRPSEAGRGRPCAATTITPGERPRPWLWGVPASAQSDYIPNAILQDFQRRQSL